MAASGDPALPDRFLPRLLDAVVLAASAAPASGAPGPEPDETSATVRWAAAEAARLEWLYARLDADGRTHMVAAHAARALGPARAPRPALPTWRAALAIGAEDAAVPTARGRLDVLVVDPGGRAADELRAAAAAIRADLPRLAVALSRPRDWLEVPALVLELGPAYALGLAGGDDPAHDFLVARAG